MDKYNKKYKKYKNKYLNIKKNYDIDEKKFDNIKIYNEKNNLVDLKKYEHFEQSLAKQHILPSDKVLELGARYGSVSIIVNKILENKKNQVVVEPDERVWKSLELNKKINNCKFHIFKGIISNEKYSLKNKDLYEGYATTMTKDPNSNIKITTVKKIKKKYDIDFNVLIVDCEGCFEIFLKENEDFVKNLRMIMYEADYPNKCDYVKIENFLIENNYKIVDIWSNQYVWKKIKKNENVDLTKQIEYLEKHRKKNKLYKSYW